MSFKENMVDLENGKYFGWLGSECFTVVMRGAVDQRPGQLTPALQVHHSIQVIRDGIPGIGDELGEARIHFLLHLIVSARKMAMVNQWGSLKASPSPA